jgi:Flp pilus assembly pilin Flp
MLRGVLRSARDEAGQDAAEYALVMGFVVMAIIAGLALYSQNLGVVWGLMVDALSDAFAIFMP